MAKNVFDLQVQIKEVNAGSNELDAFTSTCFTSTCFTSTCFTSTCFTSSCFTGQQMCGYTYTTSC